MTAHYLCRSTYAVQAGDTVVVHAGAGGVGLLLTQLVRGARRARHHHRVDAGEGRALPGRGRRARRRLRRAGRHGARGHRRRGRAGGLRRRRARRPSRPRWRCLRRRGHRRAVRRGQRPGAAVRPAAAQPGRLALRHPADARRLRRHPRGAAVAGRRAVRRRRWPAASTSGSARPTRSTRPGRPTRTCRAAGRRARSCCSPADPERQQLRCAATAPVRRAASATAASRARGGLLAGQGAVRGPQPQPVGQRLAALADLRAGVDVEELHRLDQRRRRPPAAPPRRRPPASPRRRRGRRPAAPAGRSTAARPRRPPAPPRPARRGRARPRTSAPAARARSTTCGCSSPAWPTSVPSGSVQRARTARDARAGGRRRRVTTTSTRRVAATARARRDRVGPVGRPALAPPAARLALTGQGQGDPAPAAAGPRPRARPARRRTAAAPALGCWGGRRRSAPAGSPGPSSKTAEVAMPAADVAAQHRQQGREQRGAQLRLLVGQRVGQPQRRAGAGRRPASPKASWTSGDDERVAQHLDAARGRPASATPSAGPAGPAVSPRPGGATGSTDGIWS